MTKTKSTKRALLMSGLALLMCVSMLIGSTFAWFTDSVTSSGNIIKSGTLDVTMEWKDATASGAQQTYKDASEGAIFNYDKWEPGFVEAKNIKIGNAGNLALKYQLNIVATGEVSELTDVIDVYYAEAEYTLADRNMSELTKIGTLTEVLAAVSTTASGDLLAGESDTVTLALKMQESAGNQYQDLSIGSEFAVQLLATQLTSETDSFDDQYDADADYVVYYNTPGTYELNATLMATKATDVITVQGSGVVLNITGGYYDAGNQDCAVWARNGGVVNIYGGTFIGDGVGTATSELHQDLIYASTDSKINIYGGFFSSRTEDWLLNELDGKGEIVVYGGTFVNWNPADNVSEGPNTNFVADGYEVIVETEGEDTYYMVVEKPAEAIAIYSADDASLTFYREATVPEVGATYAGKTVTAVYTGVESTAFSFDGNKTYPGWIESNYKTVIKTVDFQTTVQPISTASFFDGMRALETITNIDRLDVSKVTNMGYMFNGCSSLTSLDLSSFNTANVTKMMGMFYGCENLTVDCSSWDVSSVIHSSNSYACAGCSFFDWFTDSVTAPAGFGH